jgi:hypothetical protein
MKATRLVLFAFLLMFTSLSGHARGVGEKDLMGTWALKIEGKSLFIIELHQGAGKYTGRFVRPVGLEVTNTIFRITDPSPREYALKSASFDGAALTASFVDKNNDETVFVIKDLGGKTIEIALAGVPPEAGMGPWTLEKVEAGQHLSEQWQPNRSYVVGDSEQPNAEMEGMFQEDQRARMSPQMGNQASVADAERRSRTRELLRSGALRTGRDFKNAAFIMQHGESSDDYLLAHSLAVAALAKGESTAAWIASASLDRFLRAKGLRQIYGTQRVADPKGLGEPADMDAELVPDTLRVQLGVPSIGRAK